MNPPKCKICQKAEWAHVCAPTRAKRQRSRAYMRDAKRRSRAKKKPARVDLGG